MRHRSIAAAFFLIAVVAVLIVLWQRRDNIPRDRRETSFADLDSYFASNQWRRSDKDRVVFVGIDGASWQFIDPLIEKGMLPNFARLKREGACAPLRSVPCYFSPPAWATMLSGYLPHKTGIYTFGKWNPATREFVNVNSEDVAVPSVWDVASYGGKRVAVVNVPMTYPVHAVNGVAVSGLMTPIESRKLIAPHSSFDEHRREIPVSKAIKSYSPVLVNSFDDSLNSFRWSLYDTVDDRVQNYDKVHVAVFSKRRESSRVGPTGRYTFDVGRYSPWIRVRAPRNGNIEDGWCKLKIFESSDGFYRPSPSRVFFKIAARYCYPDSLDQRLQDEFDYYLPTKFLTGGMVPEMAEEAARHAEFFYEYEDWDLYLYVFTQSDNIHHTLGFSEYAIRVYRSIDRFIGGIMDRMPPNATLIIASDHGFGRYRYGIDLNQHFAANGLLRWSAEGKIDHEKTLVFHNLWHLYFNDSLITRDGLRAHGIDVPPGADPADVFRRHLQALGRNLTSPDGRSATISFESLTRGVVEGPDMLVHGASGEYFVEFWNLNKPQSTLFHELSGGAQWEHTRDGVFIAWGKGIQKGLGAGVQRIQDVAPTILYLLDLPIGADMDGSVIDPVFTPRYLARNPKYSVADYAEIRTEALDSVDRESLEKKLRNLGYIR